MAGKEGWWVEEERGVKEEKEADEGRGEVGYHRWSM